MCQSGGRKDEFRDQRKLNEAEVRKKENITKENIASLEETIVEL